MSNTVRRNKKTRKPERDGYNPSASRGCEHNGGCPWCKRNRLSQQIRSETYAQNDIKDFYRGNQWDYIDQYEFEDGINFLLEDLANDVELPETDWENYKVGKYDFH